MKKIFKITLVVLFLGLIPMSCNMGNCGIGNNNNIKDYHIKSFSAYQTDVYGEKIDTVTYKDYDSIAITIKIDKTQDVVSNQPFNLNIFNQTAFACDPIMEEPVEKISKIDIISLSEFDMNNEIHTNIGDTITELFTWRLGNQAEFIKLDDYSKPSKIYQYETLLLKLKNGFDKNTDCKFDIKITLSDNSIHEFNNQVLKVK